MEFVETIVFTRQIRDLLTEDEYLRFQLDLAINPAMGAVIRGGGGIRKIRISVGNRGKRGGARVIYYWAVRRNLVLLLLAIQRTLPPT